MIDTLRRWVGRVLLPLIVLALAATFAIRTDAGLDLGFHLATGRWILEQGRMPALDPFTYTVPDHPYITMHGLFQVVAAVLDRLGGDLALAGLRVTLILGTVALWFALLDVRGHGLHPAAACVLALGLCAWEVRFFLRPELVSCVALAATLVLLERRRSVPSRDLGLRSFAPLFVVQLLWTWSHALSMFGPFVVGLDAVGALLSRDRGRALRLGVWTAGLGLTLLLNPYGIEGVRLLLSLSTRLDGENAFAQSIAELQSPFIAGTELIRPLIAHRVLLVVAGLSVVAPGVTMADRLRILAFGVLSAVAMRNISLFVVVAAVPLARGVAAGSRWIGAWARRRWSIGHSKVAPGLASVAVLAGLSTLVLSVRTNRWYLADRRGEEFGIGPCVHAQPTGTLDWMREHPVPGPIWNHLNFGGALIGAFGPERKVFIDGRLEVMGERFWQQSQWIQEGPGWAAMITAWDPDLALVPNTFPRLLNRLATDPGWQLVEIDGAAALFLRVREQYAPLVAEARARWQRIGGAEDPHAAPRRPRGPEDRRSVFAEAALDWTAFGRANTFYYLGWRTQARAEYQRALANSDRDHFPIVQNLAATNFHLGRTGEAVWWYRRALELDPGSEIAQARLRELGVR